MDETAVRIFGGRCSRRDIVWAQRVSDGPWIDSAGSPRGAFTGPAGCFFDGSSLSFCFVAKGTTTRCHMAHVTWVLVALARIGSGIPWEWKEDDPRVAYPCVAFVS
jgi:hypothetical protein